MTTQNQERVCTNCGRSVSGKRRNAKFCSNTCRSKYWLKNKADKKDDPNLSPELKGVLGSSSLNENISSTKNKFDLSAATHELKLINLRNRLRNKEKELEILNINIAELSVVLGSKFGSTIGRNATGDAIGEITGTAAGFVAAAYLASHFPEEDLKQKEKKIKDTKKKIEILKKEIADLEKSNFHESSLKDLNTPSPNSISNSNTKSVINKQNGDSIINKLDDKSLDTILNTDKRIISSKELSKYEYDEFNLKGNWLKFIGKPSKNFFCVIYGPAGQGKSTFAIQFVNYLAENYSKAIYISGEEGFSKTFKDKIDNLEAFSDNLFIGDLKSFKEIEEVLKKNHFHFIVIDSLNTLHMGPEEMKKLRLMLPNNAFITISQSTKNGQMRGSNELIHDSDIVIHVENGTATTTKNRFLEKGQIFNAFNKINLSKESS